MSTGNAPDLPLVLADESSAGPFVTGGPVVRLPADRIDAALAALTKVKSDHGIDPTAEIHCRVLFYGDSRRRFGFRSLDPPGCVKLISDCIAAMNMLGATWWECWVNRDEYPTDLQLVGGERFDVQAKHLAGVVVQSALVALHHRSGGPHYRLSLDPDPTKIDWGLANRVQATHFQRTHPQAIALPEGHKPLLEMADVAAYTLCRWPWR